MAANGGLHDMNDDIAEIDQNPLAAFFALGRNDLAAGFAHLVFDIARQRPDLTVRFAAGNDDAFKQRRELGGIDDFDVVSLDVLKGADDEFF